MTENHGEEHQAATPLDWQDWQRWVEDVDWSDWRSWLQRVASTDWTAGPWPATPWEQAPSAGEISLTLQAFEEGEPGHRIGEHMKAISRRSGGGGALARTIAPVKAKPGRGSRNICPNLSRCGSG